MSTIRTSTRLTGIVAATTLGMQVVAPPPALAQEAPRFRAETFAAENCVNGRALLRRTERLRAEAAANGIVLPALATFVVTADGVRRTAVAGVRDVSADPQAATNQARLGDRFDYGSVGKNWTLAAIAALESRGVLSFDDTLGEIFGQEINPAYRQVTLGQVARFESGLPGLNDSAEILPVVERAGVALGETPAAEALQRFAREVLNLPPINQPGTEQVYSSGGYAVLGAAIERATGRKLQDVIRDTVFTPAGASFFDRPGQLLGPNEPRGHAPDETGVLVPLGDAGAALNEAFGAFFAGAGLNQAGSIEDYARVEEAQLRGLAGDPSGTALSAEQIQRFYERQRGTFGNFVEDGQEVFFRIGGGGFSTAASALLPDGGVGAGFMTNADISSQTGGQGGASVDGDIGFAADTIAQLAELAGRGIGSADGGDQAAVFASLERVCAGAGGGSDALVALFGEALLADSAGLAEAIAPDDARALRAATIEQMDQALDLLGAEIAGASPAARRPRQQGEPAWRAFILAADRRGETAIDPREDANVTSRLVGYGLERWLGPHVRLGAVYVRSESAVDLDAARGRAQTDANQALIYGAYDQTLRPNMSLFSDLTLSLAELDLKSRRLIQTGAIDLGAARADRDGRAIGVDARIGVANDVGPVRLAPFIGVRHIDIRMDAAREAGSLAALRLAEDHIDSTRLRAGVAAATRFEVSGWTVAPTGEVAWVGEVNSPDAPIRAGLIGDGAGSRFAASPSDNDWGEARAGLTLTRGRVSIRAAAEGAFKRESAESLGWSVRGSVRF